jgi:choline dehydrogenase
MTESRYDYIVIGGGAAGGILSARLAEGARVLLIERGSAGAASTDLSTLPQTQRLFTDRQAALHGRRVGWLIASVLGGGTAINSRIYIRGHRRDYDHWRESGNVGWGYRDVLPCFKRSQNQERGPSEYHGIGGAFEVSDARNVAEFSLRFIDACAELGIARNADFNAEHQEGAGLFQFTELRGVASNTALAFVSPAQAAGNLTVLTGCQAERLLFEGSRAVGVRYRRASNLEEARAEREIILCAGAVHSPALLLASGVGPADALRRLGVHVSHDLPGVGENLQDHVRVPVLYEWKEDNVCQTQSLSSRFRAMAGRVGELAANDRQAGAFVGHDDRLGTPELQFVTRWRDGFGCVDLEVCLMHPHSRGRVSLRTPDAADVVVDPSYLSVAHDTDVLVRGIDLARQLARTGALASRLGAEVLPGPSLRGRDDLVQYLHNEAQTAFHPVGTCRMGAGPAAVVDHQLRVHGLEGLRVADASIMPEIPTGNTAAPTMMIGEKAADLIRTA